jgi:hypothetical protein
MNPSAVRHSALGAAPPIPNRKALDAVRQSATPAQGQAPTLPPSLSDGEWLCGRTVVHKIVVGLTSPTTSVPALLTALAATSGQIRSLIVKPVLGGVFEATLQATHLSPEEARRLVDRVATCPEVSSAAIEHVLIS